MTADSAPRWSGVPDRTDQGSRLWQRPTLRRNQEERRVGWLELFFDLVFVVILAALAHDLQAHLTDGGIVEFLLKFMAVFWVWNAFTYYTERFESAGIETRLFTFVAIVAVAGLAVYGEDAFGHHYAGFIVSYLLARGLNIGLWARAAYHEPRFRAVAGRFAGGFALAVALIAVSALVDGPLRLLLWVLAVGSEIATPALTVRLQAALPPISSDKFPERFGLLTMIVLGESLSGVIRGLSTVAEQGGVPVTVLVEGLLRLALGFLIWWLYYDSVARRPTRPRFSAALIWVYLHLLLLASIVAVGVAATAVVTAPRSGALPGHVQTLLLLAGASTICCLAAIGWTLQTPQGTSSTRLPATGAAGAGVLVLLAVLQLPLSGVQVLVLATATFSALAAHDTARGRSWTPWRR